MTGCWLYSCWARADWLVAPLALFAHGTVGSTMVYGCHELGHGTVFHTKSLNTLFLYLYSVLFWWDPYDYAASHTYHHRYTQHAEGDRENVFPHEPSLDPWVMLELFTLNLTAGPGRVFGKGGMLSTIKLTAKAALGGIASEPHAEQHEWLTAVHEDQPQEVPKSMWFSRAIVLFHALTFTAAIASGQWIFVFIVNIHCFFANWLSYFVGNCQHCGLVSAAGLA